MGGEKNRITLKNTVLYEDGDNIPEVMEAVRDIMVAEAIAMVEAEIIDQIKQ